MRDLTDSFLAAFGRIEVRLNNMARTEDYVPFNKVLTILSDTHMVVRKKASALRRFGQLRNFLTHDNQRDMAIPNESTVRFAENLAELFEAAPQLLVEHFAMKVETCGLSERIGIAAKVMHDKCFSQLPIVHSGCVVGLLTSETIARWVGARLAESDRLQEETVEEVQGHQEEDSKYILVGNTYSIEDALKAYFPQVVIGISAGFCGA